MLLVVDANELFSAMIARKKTLELFYNSKLELVAPGFIVKNSGINSGACLEFLSTSKIIFAFSQT
ncbi:hypothetical protein HYW75_01515 [Candidatus Pacearchaeota archaeon]|nr:hypothetical protein [Candidatus Pacearchaeota archaeon]